MDISKASSLPRHFPGSSKVFISDIVAAGLASKEELLSAHRAGKVELSRADLSNTLDQDKVKASECGYSGALFHLLYVGR